MTSKGDDKPRMNRRDSLVKPPEGTFPHKVNPESSVQLPVPLFIKKCLILIEFLVNVSKLAVIREKDILNVKVQECLLMENCN